jgi:biotin carboxyl carrier protein
MTRRFTITVDGVSYDVTVEERDAGAPPAPPPTTAPRGPAPPPAAPAATATAGGGGLAEVASPLAGTVVEVHVAAGDSVTQGGTVITIEAMKMNTSVPAPRSGTVKRVAVEPGTSVAEGQVLLTID